jgi:hypothetical protein
LFIHGLDDPVVPVEQLTAVTAAGRNADTVVPCDGHTLLSSQTIATYRCHSDTTCPDVFTIVTAISSRDLQRRP